MKKIFGFLLHKSRHIVINNDLANEFDKVVNFLCLKYGSQEMVGLESSVPSQKMACKKIVIGGYNFFQNYQITRNERGVIVSSVLVTPKPTIELFKKSIVWFKLVAMLAYTMQEYVYLCEVIESAK